jgi:hypothetical protein
MHGHGKTYQEIATTVKQTIGVVTTAIRNHYVIPDNIAADYKFVDGATRRMYPPEVRQISYSDKWGFIVTTA